MSAKAIDVINRICYKNDCFSIKQAILHQFTDNREFRGLVVRNFVDNAPVSIIRERFRVVQDNVLYGVFMPTRSIVRRDMVAWPMKIRPFKG